MPGFENVILSFMYEGQRGCLHMRQGRLVYTIGNETTSIMKAPKALLEYLVSEELIECNEADT